MSYIKATFIDALLERAHIDEVIGKYLDLKRAGANFKAKSPFSDDKTASLMVSPVKNIWKDFSSGKGGNVVSFIMEKESCTYPEAIEKIAEIYNEAVEYEAVEFSEKKKEVLEKKEELRKVLKATHELYQKQMLALPEEHAAIQEVKIKRQYSDDTILEWGIGFAPDNFLYNKLSASGKVYIGEDLGLIKNQWDKYSNRVVYPIHDSNGLIIGLGGRDITGKSNTAKWINPNVDASNLLYNKSKVWYGLHKAKMQIRKRGEAFLTEGYNDVIAAHLYDLENTIASCGTSITEMQINEIKKLCTKVVFWMDPDAAGKAAVLKQIPLFIKQGFRTEVISTDLDPDDFSRKYSDVIALAGGLNEMFKVPDIRKDGFKILLDHYIQGSDIDKSTGAKILAEIISKINDDAIVEIYRAWLAKESKVSVMTIKKWIKEFIVEEPEVFIDSAIDYVLPEEVKEPLNALYPVIKEYGLFMSNNKIFMQLPNSDKKAYFTCVSNFMIEVLQHMNDDKFPRKLVKMKNIENKEVIFDTASENINTPQSFDNMITSYGNFRFDGDRKDQLRLRRFLMDNMGDGKKIDVMGWQLVEKIWIWNNAITDINGLDIPIDENGMFTYEKVNYYVPSANKIYKGSPSKYKPQKSFIIQKNEIPFNVWMNKVFKVHRDHAISGLLFGVASLFQDLIVSEYKAFPILFLYGPGSSGKDGLIRCIQSLIGIPQNAISLEGDVSTAKGQIRKFAQFRNGTVHLSEFYTGNAKLDGMLKGMYDRIGYEKGNIESSVSTDSVEIESSVLLTGNQYPDKEALITRLVWNEMTKTQFSESEMKEYNELSDMTNDGASGYANDLFKYRKVFEQKFSGNFRLWKGILEAKFKEPKARIIANLAVLGSTYQILRDDTNSEVVFPFSQDDMLNHFGKEIKNQLAKMNSASLIIRFWHCFIASLRGHKDTRIQVGYIVNLEGNTLYFNWTHVIHKMEDLWWRQYKEGFPGSATLKEEFIKENLIVKNVSSYSFNPGRAANRTSAVAINLLRLPDETREDIIGYIMFQKEEGTFWKKKEQEGEENNSQPTLPLSYREMNEEDLGFL